MLYDREDDEFVFQLYFNNFKSLNLRVIIIIIEEE